VGMRHHITIFYKHPATLSCPHNFLRWSNANFPPYIYYANYNKVFIFEIIMAGFKLQPSFAIIAKII